MKCAEIQKNIYLFNELELLQQEEIMAHLNNCADCKRVFDQVGHSRQLIQQVATTTPQLQDSFRFTNQVMSSIRTAKQKNLRSPLIDILLDYLSARIVKYSMATLSIVFVGFFLTEFTKNNEPSESLQVVRVTPQLVKLNTASFFQQFQKVKTEGQTGASISQCLNDCRHNPQVDCSSCKTKYLNIIKHHEKI